MRSRHEQLRFGRYCSANTLGTGTRPGRTTTLCTTVIVVVLFLCRFPYFLCPDEPLGKPFKAILPTEDIYVYQHNGPTFEDV